MTPNIETIIRTIKTARKLDRWFKLYELAEIYEWSRVAYKSFPGPIQKVVSLEEFGYFVVMNYVHEKYRGKDAK